MSKNLSEAQGIPPYAQFSTELSDALQRCAETYLDEFDEHQAFSYLIAELFSTTNPPHFEFTDGPNDGGIDFFVRQGDSYLICQSKCSDLKTLQASLSAQTFDDRAVDDLISAINMLRNPEGKYKVSRKIRMLRTDYQRDQRDDPESRLLTGILAVSGVLTPSANTKFGAEQKALKKAGVTLRLVTWEDIYRKLHFQELDVDSIRIDLECDDAENALLRYQDYCYMLACAHSFNDAFRQHEWNLFDWNVRLQLTNSPINSKIVRTLQKEKSRKRFHHYNNGILITCNSYKVDEKHNTVRLHGAQIVNGCQTVRAICEAYEPLDPVEQENFRETARVQVKIIKNTDPDFINELTITTNDQNPMNQRNLRSNTSEQKGIQNEFRGMRPSPWFYERKDGEFKSLSSASVSGRWFRKSDYSAEKGRIRMIDNEELAKVWYSFIGHSDEVVRGGIDFFENEDLYVQIFKRSPNAQFWSAFSMPGTFSLTDEFFDTNTPSAYMYLLAYTVFRYVRLRVVSTQKNKEAAIERGLLEGSLKSKEEAEINNFLASDPEYRFNIMFSNMKDIMVELYAVVLSARYRAVDAQLCSRLVASHEIAEFSNSGFLPEKAPSPLQDGTRVIGPIYEFLRYSTQQFFFANQAEIQAAARTKAYLWQRRVVTRMRDNVFKMNSSISDYDVEWKSRGKTFLDSLP